MKDDHPSVYDHVYRFGSKFTLVPFDDLDDRQRDRFRGYIADKRYYGLLHAPQHDNLTIKAVNRDLADFLIIMRTPQPLSSALKRFAHKKMPGREQFIVQLVLDSVLEVLDGEEWVSGVEAVNRVLLETQDVLLPPDTAGKQTFIQHLSERAMFFGVNCPNPHPRDVSFILYNFNRIPLGRKWKRRLPDDAALRQYLDLNADNSWPGMPDWVSPQAVRVDEDGRENAYDLFWRSWKLKGRKLSRQLPSYKIYISPVTGDLPEVFKIVRSAAADSKAHAMKIGRSLPSILRPDKLIVYFPEYPLAREFAVHTATRLRSYPAHGTPFTYQVDPETAVVTMGVDPPARFGEKYSWRLYVVQKLALAIQAARRSNADGLRDNVRSYLHHTGVDSHHWRPVNDNWKMDFRIEEAAGASA